MTGKSLPQIHSFQDKTMYRLNTLYGLFLFRICNISARKKRTEEKKTIIEANNNYQKGKKNNQTIILTQVAASRTPQKQTSPDNMDFIRLSSSNRTYSSTLLTSINTGQTTSIHLIKPSIVHKMQFSLQYILLTTLTINFFDKY